MSRDSSALLAIETSTRYGGVAVGREDEVLAEVGIGVRARQSESLLPAVDYALGAARLRAGDLGGIVVGGGPGSFTGVRIAGATAKGLVAALGVPLFAYSGLLALAASLGTGARPVCALFDARRGRVYAACYRFPAYAAIETLLEPMAASVDEVLDAVGRFEPDFAGDGALRNREAIEAAGGAVAPPHFGHPRAAALLWLARLSPEAGRIAEPAAWEPMYLRESVAARPTGGG